MKGRKYTREMAFAIKNDKKNVINLGESEESDILYDKFKLTKIRKAFRVQNMRQTLTKGFSKDEFAKSLFNFLDPY